MEDQQEDSIEHVLKKAQADLETLNLVINEARQRLSESGNATAQAIAQAEEAVEATKTAAAELLDLQAKASTARTHAAEILTAKTQIEDLQAVVAAKSDHIEQAQVHADKVRSNLDRLHTQAAQKLVEVEASAQSVDTHAKAAADHLAAAKASRASVETDKASVDAEVEKIGEVLKQLRKFAADSGKAEEKMAGYETKLEEYQRQVQERIATIDGLLPGATSASLATAFDERRKTFLRPSNQWQWVFVGALTLLVLVALSGLWHVFFAKTPSTYDELFRLWLARLPIAGALVWLAIYASRESSLAKRLEEDYGYKAAISASFQGFHRQMSDITDQAGTGTPVAKLCADTLTTIATPPGRIYDKHNLTITPSGELTEMVRAVLAKEKDSISKGVAP